MGQVPPKYMLPSAPYGQSDAVNAVNAVQPAAVNPQMPLQPVNLSGSAAQGFNPQAPRNPFSMNPVRYPQLGNLQDNYRKMFGQ